jgi:outer membrane biosynthesis protein TonB
MVGMVFLTVPARTVLSADRTSECCPTREARLSAGQMKARLRHTVPVQPPALGKDVRIKGVVVLVVGLDVQGDVACIRLVSGHPLLVAPAIDSVKRWKFQAGVSATCGRLALGLSTTKPDMGLTVLETEPSSRQRP